MTEPDVLRIILSLIFVIALILGGSWLARRAGWVRTGQVSGMKLLGVQSLGARAYIAMVQVEDTRLVVGVTQQNITLLHTLDGSTTQGPGATVSGSGSGSGSGRSDTATTAPSAAHAPTQHNTTDSLVNTPHQGNRLTIEPAEDVPVTRRNQGFSQMLATVLKKR